MANNNPIKTTDNGTYPIFEIPKKFANKKITITTTTSLSKTGWELDLIHAMRMTGTTIDFDPTPDIEKAELETGKNLDGKKFALVSIATRIRNGGTPTPPKVNYAIKFESGNDMVDEEFTIISDETNPITFYTKITFKLKK